MLAQNARAAPGKLSVSRAGVEGFHFRGAPRLDRPAGRTAGGAARESKTLRRKGTGPLVRTCHAERPRPPQRMRPPARVKVGARPFAAVWESEAVGVRRDLARPDDGKSDTAGRDVLCAELDDPAIHRGSRNGELFQAPRAPADTGHFGRRLPGAGPSSLSVVKHGRSPSFRVERLHPARRPGAEWRRWWQWRKESAPVGARQGRRCRIPSLRGCDPGEWSCSDDESPEAAVSAKPSRLRLQRTPAPERQSPHRNAGCIRSRTLPAWLQL